MRRGRGCGCLRNGGDDRGEVLLRRVGAGGGGVGVLSFTQVISFQSEGHERDERLTLWMTRMPSSATTLLVCSSLLPDEGFSAFRRFSQNHNATEKVHSKSPPMIPPTIPPTILRDRFKSATVLRRREAEEGRTDEALMVDEGIVSVSLRRIKGEDAARDDRASALGRMEEGRLGSLHKAERPVSAMLANE